ncbi:MAG TPA: TetR/AcrR family transcriptional regulator [Polyangiaceae bacterium]|nr:TetR/AcrR family transcriptional regulator [Polyangiaceae bacterium]
MSTRREETRERILVAARTLLATRGYNGAGVDDIARAAGITRQAIYGHHFASKTDLLLALIEHVDRVEHVADLFIPAAQARSGKEALQCLVEGVAQLWPRVYDIASVLDSARLTDKHAEIAWQSRARVRRAGAEGVIRMLRAEGHLDPSWTVPAAADFALGVLSSTSYDFLVRQCGWTLKQFAERCTKALFATLIVQRARKPAKRARRK